MYLWLVVGAAAAAAAARGMGLSRRLIRRWHGSRGSSSGIACFSHIGNAWVVVAAGAVDLSEVMAKISCRALIHSGKNS